MAEPRKPDSRGLNFFDITDFSPGIYDASLIAAGTPPNTVPGIFPAPPGAADATHTFGCMSLPTGGLGPMPKMVQSHSMGDYAMSTPAGKPTFFTSMFSTAMNADASGGDELVVIQNYNDGTDFKLFVNSLLWQTTGANNNLYNESFASGGGSTNYPYVTCYPFMTRVAAASPLTTVGNPTLVIPISLFNATHQRAILLYPDPAAINTYGTAQISTVFDWFAFTFGHQGRICALIQVDGASGWPTPSLGLVGYYDGVSYTEPPNSETWGSQDEVFGPESPYGYGAVSSVSAGELFLVKTRGGAIIIQGDLNNPTVTTLTAVKSTGPIWGRSGSDPNGTYYCSADEGAWVWNGGNASTKVSAQLDDNFFSIANPIPPLAGNGNVRPYGYFCQRWGEWMLFSNNWVYSAGSWWRLYDPSVQSFFFYSGGFNSNIMYACVPFAPTTSTQSFFQFDRTQPTNAYEWQSLPIKLPAEDRTSTTRELVIRASNPYADVAPQIIASVVDDKGAVTALDTWHMTAGINTVQEARLNAGMKQSTTVAVRLACSGTTKAPVVHSLSLGYRTREHAALA